MSDSTMRSGNEPSLGGNDERTGQEPGLGGREAQQLRAALQLVARIQLGDVPTIFDGGRSDRETTPFLGANRRDAQLPRALFGNSADLMELDRQHKQMTNRVVLLTANIDEEVAKLVIAQLLFYERENPGEDIVLIINSAGGVVYPGLAILDVMAERVRCPIITIGTGLVAGFAILPLIAGTKGKRYITPDCQIVRSPLYSPGDRAQSPATVQEISRLTDLLNSTILKHTLLPEEDLPLEGEHYISPEEALRLGFVDHILRAPAQQTTE